MPELHAQPYDTSATGFYFTSYEDYAEKYATREPVEEYEIQFIDGDNAESDLANIVGLTQCTIERYFELLDENYDDDQLIALGHLKEHCGYDLETCIDKLDEVMLHHGTAPDYAHECAIDVYSLEGFAARYFDADAYARDLELSGCLVEAATDVWVVNADSL
jgi:antirestriction protein